MLSLAQTARALGGEVSGGAILCPGPGHSPQDRSLRVWLRSDAPDGFVVHSFVADDFRACRDYVRERLGICGPTPRRFSKPAPPQRGDALKLWDQARDPRGTVVETYLARRGVMLPAGAAGEAIRFHPSCPFGGERVCVMLALVRDVMTDEPKALHRTALDASGNKIEVRSKSRMALGPIAGGAVKLTPNAEVSTALGIGEGIESTLSLRRILEFDESPVWALLTAGGVENFPVLSGIETLWIAVDNDSTGIKKAKCASSRWRHAGREVFCVQPVAAGNDLNDIVTRGRE